MTDKIQVKCAKCGNDFDLDAKWEGFAKKYPDRVTCPSCKNGGGAGSHPTSKATSSKSSAPAKQPVSAEMFVKAYDELTAAFEGRVDEVKEYLGGWASTIVINRSR